jgi:hypothetical protein
MIEKFLLIARLFETRAGRPHSAGHARASSTLSMTLLANSVASWVLINCGCCLAVGQANRTSDNRYDIGKHDITLLNKFLCLIVIETWPNQELI